MIIQAILTLIGLLVATLVASALKSMYSMRQNLRKFKQNSNDMPMLDGFSWIGGNLNRITGKKVWKVLDEQHKKHGTSFLAMYSSQPMVSTLDLDLIRTMIHDEPPHTDRVDGLGIDLPYMEGDNIMFAQREQWRRLRKALVPALSKQKIMSKTAQEDIKSTIDKFVGSWERRFSKAQQERGEKHIVVDVEDLLHRYTIELLFAAFFKQFDKVDFDAETEWWQHLLGKMLGKLCNPLSKYAISLPVTKPLITFLLENVHPIRHPFRKVREFISAHTRSHFEARMKLEAAHKYNSSLNLEDVLTSDGQKFRMNMMDYITDQFSERKINEREYMHTAIFLFVAANKTSADALSKLFYFLSVHPETQEKLRQSILLDGADSQYLMWCINETLRLFPPAHIGCSRLLYRDLTTSEGHLIPAGTFVITPVFTIHRLRRYWGEDAEEFKPERWANTKYFHPAQFMPFGLGARRCPGGDFAMYEVKQLAKELMLRYKFEYVSGDPMAFEAPFLIFCIANESIHIKITKVEASNPNVAAKYIDLSI